MNEPMNRRFSDDMLVDLKSKVDQIYDILIGKGSPDVPGLVVRVDRLEQTESYRQRKNERAWQSRLALWGAVITLIIERAYHYLLLRK